MNTKIRLFPKKIIYFALYFVKVRRIWNEKENNKNKKIRKNGTRRRF